MELPDRQFSLTSKRGTVKIGKGHEVALIAGPCVVENEELVMGVAKRLVDIADRLGVGLIFKSSYEKDNRGSEKNWRGPGIEDGLKILKKVRDTYGIPVLSDIHRQEDVNLAAEYIDVLQIPAYLCQQTSLVLDCGKTGKAVNVKKGQFLAPENMNSALSKLRSVGANNVLLTERGACFGYNRLVHDVRSIPIMQSLGAPVVMDSTHIIRIYGTPSSDPKGGEPQFIPHLTLSAVAAGVDALFIETHPEPRKALCDGASMLQLDLLEPMMKKVLAIFKSHRSRSLKRKSSMALYRAKLAGRYMFWEMLPSFVLGNVVFIFILLMFQVLRLSDIIISQGVALSTVMELVLYLTISFLPACIPISLLFSILLTYGRLSSDSEVVAMKASGLHMGHLLTPALVLSAFVALFSAYISFYGAPWGNRGFEVLIGRVLSTKAAATIQEGVFAEGFFDLVLYADKVDKKNGLLRDVFIYDERDNGVPVTVIAKEGKLIDADPKEPGRGVTLRLANGNIHRTTDKTYTKVDFQTYDISLSNTAADSVSEKSPPSLTYDDLIEEYKHPNKNPSEHRVREVEFHKRWALAAACLIFGILGVGAGTVTNRRAVRASGLIVSLGIMIAYWVIYISGDSLARSGALPAWLAMWTANFIFLGVGAWSIKRAW